MATVTININTSAGGLVHWEYDYDDAAVPPTVTALRCRNDSDQPAYAKLWLTNNPAKIFERITPAHTTEERPLGQNQATRFDLIVDMSSGRPRVANLDGVFNWPA